MQNRRDFLKSSALLAMAPSVPGFLTRTARAIAPDRHDRVLVVIQLDGGNDGVNTVIPYADEGYASNRSKLRIATDRLLKLNDHVGLHPALRGVANLLQKQQIAIVQGVGYPNPNRSHDVSMAIWHTARFDREEHNTIGWVGRALDSAALPSSEAPSSLLVGDESPPIAIRGRRSVSAALTSLNDFRLAGAATDKRPITPEAADNDLLAFTRRTTLDAYTTSDRLRTIARQTQSEGSYPATKLANRLKLIAQLIKAQFGTRVYYAVQSGYDTHYLQLPKHQELLGELASALEAFMNDLSSARMPDRVLVLCFSEFGRRVQENASLGTDHGTAGPLLLVGPSVRAGLHGPTPNLSELTEGDLKMSVDFREVYATVLEKWLGIDSANALGSRFERLPVL